jgi:hypothetical protein
VRVDEAPPVLALPADGATIPSLPTLSWSPVSWAADHYLVCVATPGTPCPNRTVAEGSDPNLVVVRTSNTTVGPGAGIIFPESIDLYQFKNMNVRWTVAACTSPPNWWGSEYCSWQPQTRSIRVVPDWYVGITLDRLEVHDDCDNFSAGDWRAAFSVSARKGLLITEFAWLDWPTSNGHGSRNVDSGTSLLVGQSLGLRVHETDTITFATAAVDCDNDGIWTLTNVFDGIEGVWNTIENWVQTCGGEEIYERSGDNDFVGTAVSSLGPAAWMGVHNLSVSATSPGGHDCGSNPYTAHFTVNAERR